MKREREKVEGVGKREKMGEDRQAKEERRQANE